MNISFPAKPGILNRSARPQVTLPRAKENPFGGANDTLELSTTRPSPTANRAASPPARRTGKWKQLVLTSTLVVSLFAGLAPLPALAAQPLAQTTVAAQTVEAAKSEVAQKQAVDGAVDDALKGLAGKDVKALGTQCVDIDPTCLADFGQLSREGQEAYRKIPLVGKQIMAKQLSGSYKLFGLIPIINYREAYVKGEAFGKNAFEFSINEVNKREAAGKLTPANAHNSRWFLQISSRMNPSQRAALVRLIARDVKINK